MSKLVCPQCRLPSSADCQETGCPGEAGFVPSAWQRPLHQIAEDLERYESLLLEVDAWLSKPNASWIESTRARLIVNKAAQSIRAKQKKEGRTDG